MASQFVLRVSDFKLQQDQEVVLVAVARNGMA